MKAALACVLLAVSSATFAQADSPLKVAGFWDLRTEPIAVVSYSLSPGPRLNDWLSGPSVEAFAGAQPDSSALTGFALAWRAELSGSVSLTAGPALLMTPKERLGLFAGVAVRF
jgi:hypothetical protein